MPGCGFGGSCFPKDVQALRSHARSLGVDPRVLQATLDVNEGQPKQVVRMLECAMKGLAGRPILVLGLTFKPDTDDLRESPSLKIVDELLYAGARVTAHDPVAMSKASGVVKGGSVKFVNDWRSAAEASDGVIVATKWREYEALPAVNLKGRFIVDARRMFSASQFSGSTYLGIGA